MKLRIFWHELESLSSPVSTDSVRRYSANSPPSAAAAAMAAGANAHAGGGSGAGGMSVIDSFSRGRRASMAVPTDRDRLSLMNALVMRRRLSDQVRKGRRLAYGPVSFH